jgi:hypothetical protein
MSREFRSDIDALRAITALSNTRNFESSSAI